MGKFFWFPFFPQAWRNDPDLRRCSAAARGVWIDMLCLAFECQERGVLSTNGTAWTDKEIAEAVGGDISLNLNCIKELLRKGVASRRQDGAIYSRRMVDDELNRQGKSEKCSDAGRRGGRPSKGSTKGDLKGKPKGQKRAPPRVASNCNSNSNSSFSSETEEEGSGEEGETNPVGFDVFWAAYPRKTAKADALKAWKKLSAPKELQAEILAAHERKKRWVQWTKDGGQFIPHPSTWLNGRRWEDQESKKWQ